MDEEPKESDYWKTKTSLERLVAQEYLRILRHGEDVINEEIQRVYRIIKR